MQCIMKLCASVHLKWEMQSISFKSNYMYLLLTDITFSPYLPIVSFVRLFVRSFIRSYLSCCYYSFVSSWRMHVCSPAHARKHSLNWFKPFYISINSISAPNETSSLTYTTKQLQKTNFNGVTVEILHYQRNRSRVLNNWELKMSCLMNNELEREIERKNLNSHSINGNRSEQKEENIMAFEWVSVKLYELHCKWMAHIVPHKEQQRTFNERSLTSIISASFVLCIVFQNETNDIVFCRIMTSQLQLRLQFNKISQPASKQNKPNRTLWENYNPKAKHEHNNCWMHTMRKTVWKPWNKGTAPNYGQIIPIYKVAGKFKSNHSVGFL